MQLTGAEVMVKCLEEEGVSTIFGYPGGAILPFYNALRDVKNIKHVLTAHEQGAAHAADGYARASGKVGVCCATSGPGATNLVTGLANAFLDSIPVVAITGQVKSSMIGHDAFQEVDITGITSPPSPAIDAPSVSVSAMPSFFFIALIIVSNTSSILSNGTSLLCSFILSNLSFIFSNIFFTSKLHILSLLVVNS